MKNRRNSFHKFASFARFRRNLSVFVLILAAVTPFVIVQGQETQGVQPVEYVQPLDLSPSSWQATAEPGFVTDLVEATQTNPNDPERSPNPTQPASELPQPTNGVTFIRQVTGPNATTSPPPATIPGDTASRRGTRPVPTGTLDPKLGTRIANISRPNIPQGHDQIWRVYDITPYTKGSQFPPDSKPEQTIVNWIIKRTGTQTWHSSPFSILSADSEKLYVYHTEEVQMDVADIVDRFVNPETVNEMYSIRVIKLSKPDWVTKNHQYLKPLRVASPGVEGWELDKAGARALLQEVGRRTDFQDIVAPQFLIPNGVLHQVAPKRQRTYLRDVQPNAAALNGYAEDRVTMNEGFAVSFVTLSRLDGQFADSAIKVDIVQIEKMIPIMLEIPTAANPRQRVELEKPQVSTFRLDEMINWRKDKILLLDLGMVPIPPQQSQTENTGVIGNIAKNLSTTGHRANVLLLVECVSGGTAGSPVFPTNPVSAPATGGSLVPPPINPPANPQPTSSSILVNGTNGVPPTGSAIGSNSPYWDRR